MLDEAGDAEAAQAKKVSELNADLDTVDFTADQLRGENEELYDQSQTVQRQVRFLQSRLTEAGHHSLAFATPSFLASTIRRSSLTCSTCSANCRTSVSPAR
ncbi:hypothetical protein ACFYNX_03405 [Streptomyces sp. NPDC007872]|uniref:hypothetical protein n=1 Tax=Streptomyces sp. NPDC007872 TaxID=3364782 RepID=UPI00368E2219